MQFKTVKQFVTTSGAKFESLEEAQRQELQDVLQCDGHAIISMLQHKQKVLDVLSLTERSIPAARAINGGRKPRARKHIAPQVPLQLPETDVQASDADQAVAQMVER